MAARVWRWVGYGLLPGLLPLALAYGIRFYASGRPPGLREVLGRGDALLIAVAWSVAALYDVLDAAHERESLRGGVAALCCGLVVVGSVAYGCLTTFSVMGRVQTRGQEQVVTALSLWMLGVAGLTNATTVARATPRTRREPYGGDV